MSDRTRLGMAGLAVDLVAILVSGFCFMNLWNMYIPPVFTSAPQLNFVFAAGLILVTSILTAQGKPDGETTEEMFSDSIWRQLLNGVAKPITLLVYGWILHVFV